MSRSPRWRSLAAIARADLTDRIRSGIGAALFVQPAVLLLILISGIVAPSLSPVKAGVGSRTVAVAADASAEGPAALLLGDLAALQPRFVIHRVRDVEDEVGAERADAGLRVLSDGHGLQVLVLPSRRTSRVAAAELTGALRSLQLERTGASPPTIDRSSLRRSGEAGRVRLAGLLPFLIAFQLLNLFADAATRLRGGKSDRSVEVFHVLPVPRIDLVLGRAAVGLGDGAMRLGAMLLIAGALPLVPASLATFSLPAVTLVALAVAGLCQVMVATAGGSLLGALARTDGQSSAVLAILSLGMAGGFIGLTVASPGPLPGWLAGVPFLGPTFWARNTFLSSAHSVDAVLAVGASVAISVVFILFAARALERDGVTLRET